MENLKLSTSNVTFDDHTVPHKDVTTGQLTFFLIWIGAFVIWIFRFQTNQKNGKGGTDISQNESASESKKTVQDTEAPSETKDSLDVTDKNKTVQEMRDVKIDVIKPLQSGEMNKDTSEVKVKESSNNTVKIFTAVKPPPTTDEFLKCVVIFGIVMVYFYLCDYRKIFPMLERVYDRDTFLFLVFLLFLVGCFLTLKPTTDKILNRDQTEEWKGWMQVMFVWYHVFAAKEWYNWIRVYIAAYVWMTGFGNFSFFWIRKDYSFWRFLKMQFRLNFLVTCICVITSNQYMLYYICAMHSYWFITVYVFMATFKSWNNDSTKMAIKLGVYFLANFLIFEIPVVRENVFRPLWFILQYNDPRFDPMHEWIFRAGLDHWACFIGMLCAYNYPHFENFINRLENSGHFIKQTLVKCLLVSVAVIVLFIWYMLCMQKDKYAYNEIHPYTSCIPIICFIVIRNAFPVLRHYYVEMFAWLGKITLETYLSQLHIYLQSNAKHLIGYFPNYRLLNFAFATLIYLPLSYMLFNLTTDFSTYLIPKDLKKVGKNVVLIGVLFCIPYAIISLLQFYMK